MGEMEDTMVELFGERAQGFSPGVVSRLKQQWEQQMAEWRQCDLGDRSWVYVWSDGIYSGLWDDTDKFCCLVIIGVDEYGVKEILAIEDGVRESTLSWHEVLLDLKNRSMNAPKLATAG